MKKYLQHIATWFSSQKKLYREVLRLQVQNIELKKDLHATKNNVEYLRDKLDERFKPLPLTKIDDGAPQDSELYEQYVADVANFHENIMKPKLTSLISEVRAELSAAVTDPAFPPGVPRENYDWYLRGTENALWLLYNWGEIKSGERKSLNS